MVEMVIGQGGTRGNENNISESAESQGTREKRFGHPPFFAV